jgi:hypothetical protein
VSDQQQTIFDKLASQFDQIYPALLQIVETLQQIEPGGTLTEDIVAKSKTFGSSYISYTAKPLCVAIEHDDKKFILRVLDV